MSKDEEKKVTVQAVYDAINKAIKVMVRRNQVTKEHAEMCQPLLDYAKRVTETHDCDAAPHAFAGVGKALLEVMAALTVFEYHVEEDHEDEGKEEKKEGSKPDHSDVITDRKDNVIHLDLTKTGRKDN